MKIHYHLLYLTVIFILIYISCSKTPVNQVVETRYRVDTIKTTLTYRDTVQRTLYEYRLDTLRDTAYIQDTLLIVQTDTIVIHDTINIVSDYLSFRTYKNYYEDSLFTLTVTDSIGFNRLLDQSIDINILQEKYKPISWQLIGTYSTPPAVGLSYLGNKLLIGIEYDLITQSPRGKVGYSFFQKR